MGQSLEDVIKDNRKRLNDMEDEKPKEPKKESAIDSKSKPLFTALEEEVYRFIAICFIVSSNLYSILSVGQIFALLLAIATFMFVGWVKKMGEIKITKVLKESGLKDETILTLKETVTDLMLMKGKLENELAKIMQKITPIV